MCYYCSKLHDISKVYVCLKNSKKLIHTGRLFSDIFSQLHLLLFARSFHLCNPLIRISHLHNKPNINERLACVDGQMLLALKYILLALEIRSSPRSHQCNLYAIWHVIAGNGTVQIVKPVKKVPAVLFSNFTATCIDFC